MYIKELKDVKGIDKLIEELDNWEKRQLKSNLYSLTREGLKEHCSEKEIDMLEREFWGGFHSARNILVNLQGLKEKRQL